MIISGGGTGGHIFPAISIADELRRRYPAAQILFVGAEGRMEMDKVPAAGYEIQGLPVMGFDRRHLLRNFQVVFKLMESVRRARKIIREFRPDIAIGVGGYASGPVLKVAQKKGIPTVLQEQNSYAGVTNKMLSKKADVICVAYDGMERFFPADKIKKTGNPVRSGLADERLTREEAKEKLGFDKAKPLVFVTGGSLGSRTINEAVAKGLEALVRAGCSVLWQTGRLYEAQYSALADNISDVRASAFVEDMGLAYRAADVVVSRAGASTISELQLVGLPAVLIPSPNVAEDHQTKNARALTSRDAALMISDGEAVEKLAPTVIALLGDQQRMEEMSRNIRAMALGEATSAIADEIEALIKRKK